MFYHSIHQKNTISIIYCLGNRLQKVINGNKKNYRQFILLKLSSKFTKIQDFTSLTNTKLLNVSSMQVEFG